MTKAKYISWRYCTPPWKRNTRQDCTVCVSGILRIRAVAAWVCLQECPTRGYIWRSSKAKVEAPGLTRSSANGYGVSQLFGTKCDVRWDEDFEDEPDLQEELGERRKSGLLLVFVDGPTQPTTAGNT